MSNLTTPESWPYPSHRPPIDISLVVLPEHTCSYFSDRISQSRAFLVSGIHPELYHKYMDANFRRSGQLIYQPICHTCRECKQIRVITNEFSMSKSQRRCHNRNSDLSYVIGEPAASQEKYELYSRYQTQWHHKAEEENDYDGFVSFLYRSPVQTIEYCYRDKSGKLVAVGICPKSVAIVRRIAEYL